jgi:hypothetical protein
MKLIARILKSNTVKPKLYFGIIFPEENFGYF